MQNFNSITLKLREEFEVTDRWTISRSLIYTHAWQKSSIMKILTSPLASLDGDK